jgi:hypothetical protein
MNRNQRNLGLSALVMVLAVGVVVSVVKITPQSGMAAQANGRDLSTTLSSLAGYWMSESGRRGVYYSQIDPSLKCGYVQVVTNVNTNRISRPLSFKVLSEDMPNNRIVIHSSGQVDALSNLSQKFGIDAVSRSYTRITISLDGQALTEEYSSAGVPVLHSYDYVGHRIVP